MKLVHAILLAVLVTFLWSTSWVLIKVGLRESLPPLTFAGLRYSVAFLCLAPFVLLNPALRSQLKRISSREWVQLVVLGLVYYTVTQGSQFLSLAYLPAALVSMLLNLTPLVVGVGGWVFLSEHPGPMQWLGLLLTVGGVIVYFQPEVQVAGQWFGLLIAILGVASNAASSILGRQVNRKGNLPPLLVTFTSMGIGALVLLGAGGAIQGIPRITGSQWALIGWLAVVNTALAFTLWNASLRVLNAVESSILNCLMLPQVAILAYLFLGERLAAREAAGLGLVFLGVILVQLRGFRLGARSKDRREECGTTES